MRGSPRRSPPGSPSGAPPIALHERAEADLAFVRATVERSAYFSAVPGAPGIAMGVTALGAAWLAASQSSARGWLAVWVAEAALAGLIGAVGIVQKARRNGVNLDGAPGRRFGLGLVPPIVAGAALTFGAVRADAWTLLPAAWMLCYGVGVLAAGSVSAARAVPLLGAWFVFLGLTAVASPASWGDVYLALGFGVGHIAAGAVIMRDHGG